MTVSQQISVLVKALEQLPPEQATTQKLEQILEWVNALPTAAKSTTLLKAVATAFRQPIETIYDRTAIQAPDGFDALVPHHGWLADYIRYTRNTEPPTVFHFFAGAVAIGSALGRNVYFDMGAYRIFPNLCVIVVAPSGKCRKTSACNMSVKLIRSVGNTVIADKVTPEALVTAFADQGSATGLIYAPELAVFLGRQKYNDGMVPMLTALFDCPSEWVSKTILRGETRLYNVAFSMLGCSTMDWLQSAIPKDAFGGGFMSRLLFVIQEDTDRSFPIPPPLSDELYASLHKRLLEFTRLRGQFVMTRDAEHFYREWYVTKRSEFTDSNKFFAGYFERKPDHMLRLAMILAIADGGDFELAQGHLQKAVSILNWIERYMPDAFEEMQTQGVGEEHKRIVTYLKKHGGQARHSELLRHVSYRMNARQFNELTTTLRGAGIIEYDAVGKTYYLTPEGWNR